MLPDPKSLRRTSNKCAVLRKQTEEEQNRKECAAVRRAGLARSKEHIERLINELKEAAKDRRYSLEFTMPYEDRVDINAANRVRKYMEEKGNKYKWSFDERSVRYCDDCALETEMSLIISW